MRRSKFLKSTTPPSVIDELDKEYLIFEIFRAVVFHLSRQDLGVNALVNAKFEIVWSVAFKSNPDTYHAKSQTSVIR